MSAFKETRKRLIIESAEKKGIKGIANNAYISKYRFGLGARDDSDFSDSDDDDKKYVLDKAERKMLRTKDKVKLQKEQDGALSEKLTNV